MRMLALVGASNVNLSFSSPIHKDANVQKETFDLSCTLLQPTKVNEKREEGKKFEPIKGDFSPERLISDSVPRMYKEHAYLQHTLWSLNERGHAYFFIGKGPLFREGEKLARKILIDKNAVDTVVMLPSNLMTFNPGWDKDCQTLDKFDDVRDLKKDFNQKGIETVQESLENESGPGSFSVIDPDGNVILVDQHV